MFKTILVPLDGTPYASAALPVARTIARATGANLALVCVTEPTHDQHAHARHVMAAEHNVRMANDELVRDGFRTDTLICTGRAADEIVAATRSTRADLIVMATHGRAGLQRAFAGSVTERVLGTSPVPVIVLAPGGKRMTDISRLLVAVDGTVGGALALGAATGLARATNARIELLRAVPPLPMWTYGATEAYAPAAYMEPEWEDAALESAEAYVNGLAERLRAAGIPADGRAVRGPAAASIDDVAEALDVDLIVMSTHALRGPARAVLGSVADEVVRTSKRPVLLVHRPGGAFDSTLPAEATLSTAHPEPIAHPEPVEG
jgi:nucleotide-binding universal stress UspA family protein